MTPGRWQQVTDIFHAAMARDLPSRDAYLRDACQGDESLRADVDRLLAAHRDARSFGDVPVFATIPAHRLDPGTMLGPYRIEELIGAGGMGEVYRAKDPRLHRDVALKLLPPASADLEQRKRFDREAQIIASLNHPNIVTIHSVEQSGEVQFLTMELVDGKTLREVIPATGLPIDRLIHIAAAVTDAVAAAHSRGVVHRDLKPGNVMVTRDGRIKVLDFGIAKLKGPAAPAIDPTASIASEITGNGRVIGTAAYMSPEQAEGRDVDYRSDIFSLGVMLHELAVGRRPFSGDSTVSLLSSILKDTPSSVTELRPELPRELGRVIRRCLAKDPDRRYQSTLDLRNDIEEIGQDLASGHPKVSTGSVAPARRRRIHPMLWVAIGLLATSAGVAYLARNKAKGQSSPQILRVTLEPPSSVRVAPQSAAPIIAISPDGRHVAFQGTSADAGRTGLYLRSVGELDSRLVREGDVSSPFFSPDGEWLGFWANGSIWKMRVDGGGHEKVCDAPNQLRGASWGDSGTIVFTDGGDSALRRVAAEKGQPTVLTNGTTPVKGYFPYVLPHSRAALMTVERTVALVSLENGAILHKWFAGSSPRYVNGFLVFRRLDSLYAAPFDLARLDVTGDPERILDGVAFNPGGSETSAFDVSMTGALVVVPPLPRVAEAELVWLDSQGRTDPMLPERKDYRSASFDPEGRRVAVNIANGGDSDVWIYDPANRSGVQLTHGHMANTADSLVWSLDGQWIVFSSDKLGYPSLFRVLADGRQPPEQLTRTPEYSAYKNVHDHPSSIQGNTLMFARQVGPADFDLLTMTLDPPSRAKPFLRTDGWTADGRISPDGRWVAYTVSAGTSRRVVVRSFSAAAGAETHIATDARRPRWSRDGGKLFYLKDGQVWWVPVRAGGTPFQFGPPVLAIGKGTLAPEIETGTIEPSPDGSRFFAIKRPRPDRTERQLVYVPNWLDELKSKVARGR